MHPPLKISVIIPVYRVTQYLDEALRSLFVQRYESLEVLVVDDGNAPQASAEIAHICAQHLGARLLVVPHGGAAYARHQGMLHATGDAVIFLDADDVLMPQSLQHFAHGFRQYPEAVAVYGRWQMADTQGNPLPKIRPERLSAGDAALMDFLNRNSPFCMGSYCVKRSALLALSPDNLELVFCEDWVLNCHIALAGEVQPACDAVVMRYRKHEESTTLALADAWQHRMNAFQRIYTHPAFIARVGREALAAMHAKQISALHTYYASKFAAEGALEKARLHFERI